MQIRSFLSLILLSWSFCIFSGTIIAEQMPNDCQYMCDLGSKHATDKVTHHGYHRFYPKFLDNNIGSMLEIGLGYKNSLYMWLEYFPNAHIYFMDIDVEEKGDRYTIFKADQSNLATLSSITRKIGKKVDFIIDDGSHIPEHQLLSFEYLFMHLLADGGTYIIEDIECGYWLKNKRNINYGAKHNLNLINTFCPILHMVNSEFMSKSEKQEILAEIKAKTNIKGRVYIDEDFINHISTITFGQNCIIIKKTLPYEKQYKNRVYRLKNEVE